MSQKGGGFSHRLFELLFDISTILYYSMRAVSPNWEKPLEFDDHPAFNLPGFHLINNVINFIEFPGGYDWRDIPFST